MTTHLHLQIELVEVYLTSFIPLRATDWHEVKKIKFTLDRVTKAHSGSRGVALLFL